VIRQLLLTVAESKRLIARAVARMESVRRAREEGILVICTGTTNGYLLEELLGKPIDKRAYRTGTTAPKAPERSGLPETPRIPDVVFRNGEVDPGLNRFSAVRLMGPGDVFVKGANALDYNRKVVGILIGGEDSGTIGNAIGRLIGGRVQLIVPVGLEKLVYGDILELCRKTVSPEAAGPTLFPVTIGTIVTEIEALKLLAGVEATLLTAGGIAGAEGAVRLLVEGEEEQVEQALEIVSGIQGEPRFLL
jgi:hypothetical protein